MARPAPELDRYLAFVADLRRRAPDHRFHQIFSRRLDTLLDERLAAPNRSAPACTSPDPAGPE